jgi:hypothetical protein
MAAATDEPSNYLARLTSFVWPSLTQLVRAPSHSRRAEAIGLRYDIATKIDGYNFSQGKAVSISIFRSEGTQ